METVEPVRSPKARLNELKAEIEALAAASTITHHDIDLLKAKIRLQLQKVFGEGAREVTELEGLGAPGIRHLGKDLTVAYRRELEAKSKLLAVYIREAADEPPSKAVATNGRPPRGDVVDRAKKSPVWKMGGLLIGGLLAGIGVARWHYERDLVLLEDYRSTNLSPEQIKGRLNDPPPVRCGTRRFHFSDSEVAASKVQTLSCADTTFEVSNDVLTPEKWADLRSACGGMSATGGGAIGTGFAGAPVGPAFGGSAFLQNAFDGGTIGMTGGVVSWDGGAFGFGFSAGVEPRAADGGVGLNGWPPAPDHAVVIKARDSAGQRSECTIPWIRGQRITYVSNCGCDVIDDSPTVDGTGRTVVFAATLKPFQ